MVKFRYRDDGVSIIPLRNKQRDAKKELLTRIRSKYAFIDRLCVCGAMNFQTLSEKDAFGIPQNVCICRECGLIQVSPCLTQGSYADFYQNIYPALYGDNDNLPNLFEDLLKRGAQIFNFINRNGTLNKDYLSTQRNVLEIGCSAGGILEIFHKRGHRICGVDYDQEVVSYGRMRGLNLHCGHSQTLTSEFKGLFDVVILSHVLEHFTDIKREIVEIKRLLHPKGLVYIEVPGIFSSLGQVQSDFLDFIEYDHVYYFGLNTLEQTMRLFGFLMLEGTELKGHSICALFEQRETVEPQIQNAGLENSMLINYYENNIVRLQNLEDEYLSHRLKHFFIRQLKILPLHYKLKLKTFMGHIGVRAR